MFAHVTRPILSEVSSSLREDVVMRRYPSLPALLLLVLIVPVASAFRQNPVPGASSALAGTAEVSVWLPQ
jgi:hypothetical protein